MAPLIAISAGGVRGSGTKPAAKVRVGGKTVDIKPGSIHKDIHLPCEVRRSGPTTVRITNTTKGVISVGGRPVDPGRSIVPDSGVWTSVESAFTADK